MLVGAAPDVLVTHWLLPSRDLPLPQLLQCVAVPLQVSQLASHATHSPLPFRNVPDAQLRHSFASGPLQVAQLPSQLAHVALVLPLQVPARYLPAGHDVVQLAHCVSWTPSQAAVWYWPPEHAEEHATHCPVPSTNLPLPQPVHAFAAEPLHVAQVASQATQVPLPTSLKKPAAQAVHSAALGPVHEPQPLAQAAHCMSAEAEQSAVL